MRVLVNHLNSLSHFLMMCNYVEVVIIEISLLATVFLRSSSSSPTLSEFKQSNMTSQVGLLRWFNRKAVFLGNLQSRCNWKRIPKSQWSYENSKWKQKFLFFVARFCCRGIGADVMIIRAAQLCVLLRQRLRIESCPQITSALRSDFWREIFDFPERQTKKRIKLIEAISIYLQVSLLLFVLLSCSFFASVTWWVPRKFVLTHINYY